MPVAHSTSHGALVMKPMTRRGWIVVSAVLVAAYAVALACSPKAVPKAECGTHELLVDQVRVEQCDR